MLQPPIGTESLRNTVVKMLREAKNSHLNRLNVGSKKQFWKAVKVLSKQQSTIPTLHYQEATAEQIMRKPPCLMSTSHPALIHQFLPCHS